MQAVHVLRAQKNFVARVFAPLGQSKMRCIGLGIAGADATIRVILPNECRIFLPGCDVRQFIMAVTAPTGALKHGNSALRADSSAGQDEYAAPRRHANCSLPPIK